MTFILSLLAWLGKGPLDRIFDTIDKRVDAETDRAKLKADIVKEYYKHRAEWMRAGGFWLMMMFALPLAFWFASVLVYSVFWCAGCAFPQAWTIAALPAPLDQWAGGIIVSIFGVLGVSRLRR